MRMTQGCDIQGDPDIRYQKTVKGCRYLLEEELAEKFKPAAVADGADAREAAVILKRENAEIVDKAEDYGRDIYCRHLARLIGETGTIGHLTRLAAMKTAAAEISEIENAENAGSLSHILFRSLHAVYDSPDSYAAYADKGAFDILAGMFLAAANEACVEKNMLAHLRKQKDDPTYEPLYY